MGHWRLGESDVASRTASAVTVALLLAVAMCALLPSRTWAASAPAPAPAPVPAPAPAPADEAATSAYLEADYTWTQAEDANLPASKTAFTELSNKLAAECPGVVAGAPLQSPGQGARKLGEYTRETEQLSELEEEATFALSSALLSPDRQAATVLAGAVAPLNWTNPTLTRLVHLGVSQLQERIGLAIPDVCGDIKTWVASGHKTLSPGTKEVLARRQVVNQTSAPGSSIHQLLVPYEGPDKALIAKIEQLHDEVAKSFDALDGSYRQLLQALGFASHISETAEEGPKNEVVIGRGRTAAGGKYVASLEVPANAMRQGCPLSVSIKGGNSGTGVCVSRTGNRPEPSVNCANGLLTVTAQMLPAARSVRLRLSNGREIVSRVLIVPARLGGPAGFYYQVVRGPSPIPVSLTELDVHGKALRVIKLHSLVECTKNPIKYLPDGLRTLVRGRVPQGPAFSIIEQHYRFLGHVYFELTVRVDNESSSGLGGGGGIGSSSEVSFSSKGSTKPKPSPFSMSLSQSCEPHPYAIVYGLLKAPGDMVLARVSGRLQPLHRVAFPASLHVHGALAYAVLPAIPSELVVRARDGRTIAREDLSQRAAAQRELCEGEAEG
jgi:hypothetical protein